MTLDGGDFIGKDTLVKQKESDTTHSLRYFSTEQNIRLKDGLEIYATDSDEVIGRVNNSAWSWGLEKTIGNASIFAKHRDADNGRVSVSGEFFDLTLRRKSLIDLPRRNQVPAPID